MKLNGYKTNRSHSYVTYSNYNRVISDSNNLNLIYINEYFM